MTDAPRIRLDTVLAAQRGITRHAAQTMIDAGLVTVNGRLGKNGQRIRPEDVVEVGDAVPAGRSPRLPRTRSGRHGQLAASALAQVPPVRSALAEPSADSAVPARLRDAAGAHGAAQPSAPPPLNIVYEDEWLAVIDKPAGLVVHPAPGHHGDTLADALRARGDTWSLLGGAERAGIVHRLDRDTSGLLVVARTEAAHRALAAQLRDRTLVRRYWVMVRGGFREDSGSIEAPIGRDPRDRKRMAVVDGGRIATTDFEVVERLGDETLVYASLRTGRTHQIRVHFAYIKHPVCGDAVYGRADRRLNRPALHALELSFVHPGDGGVRTFTAAPPAELLDHLAAARGRVR